MRFDIFQNYAIFLDDGLTIDDLLNSAYKYILDPNIKKEKLILGKSINGLIYIKKGMIVIPAWYNLKKYEI